MSYHFCCFRTLNQDPCPTDFPQSGQEVLSVVRKMCNTVWLYRSKSTLTDSTKPLSEALIGCFLWHSPGPRFNIKMLSYQDRKSHCGDKTVVRSSYLHNGISYTGKMSSIMIHIYWIGALRAMSWESKLPFHDEIMKWKHVPSYWSPVDSPHKGQWCGALIFFFDVCLNKLLNKQLKASELRCFWAHLTFL